MKNNDTHINHDIAIVGFGPTGAVLANLLASSGLRVLVLEREPNILQLPRAIRFDDECMRVFQTLGVVDKVLEQVAAAPGMKFVNSCGNLLIDWQRPMEAGIHGWSSCYRVHQPDLEQALRKQLTDYANLDIKIRHDVFAISEERDHVTLQYENMATGELLKSTARYVVGCDGARSLVRRLMGTSLSDLKLHERWLVVDLRLKKPVPELEEYTIQYCDPKRPMTYICGAGDRRRWEIMVMPGDDLTQINTPHWIWQQVSRWIGPEDAEMERSAIYMFHSVVARQWRNGRLMLAGDAAHQTPPFMGQGMAAGIRDAANLAWKLRDVIQGAASEDLLDSYESERSPHVREFIEGAVRFGNIIQTIDPDIVTLRDTAMSKAIEEFRTPEPLLGPGAHDDSPKGICGKVAPQFRLEDGRLSDDIAGYQYMLLISAEAASRAPAVMSKVQEYGVTSIIADTPSAQTWLQEIGACAVLIRPDRYVYGLAKEAEEVSELLARATSKTTTSPAVRATPAREHCN